MKLPGHMIERLAVEHAVGVHEDPLNASLTPAGIAGCAAGMAIVLADENHPNHRMWVERLAPAMTEEESHAD